jgi:hypothetical protein
MASAGEAYEAAVRRRFVRRWRIAGLLMLLYAAANLLRVGAPLAGLVPSKMGWLRDIWLWFPLVMVPAIVGAARCPACGGWVRLDGKTCAACKRDLRGQEVSMMTATPVWRVMVVRFVVILATALTVDVMGAHLGLWTRDGVRAEVTRAAFLSVILTAAATATSRREPPADT